MTNLEININVHAPELAAAITKLAGSLSGGTAVTGVPELSPAAKAMQQLTATAPAPAPIMTAQQTAAPVQQPVAAPIPATTTAAPVPTQQPAPVTAPAAYTMEQLVPAAGELVRLGKQPELVMLLGKYGAQSMTQLVPAQYDAFAADLRAMGAKI